MDKADNNKVIYGFDLLKFLMALMIVAVHARAFEEPHLYKIMAPLMNVSVPLFFILSSFFLFRKILETDRVEYVIRFLKRTSTLYGFWLIINIPLYLYENKPATKLIEGG